MGEVCEVCEVVDEVDEVDDWVLLGLVGNILLGRDGPAAETGVMAILVASKTMRRTRASKDDLSRDFAIISRY